EAREVAGTIDDPAADHGEIRSDVGARALRTGTVGEVGGCTERGLRLDRPLPPTTVLPTRSARLLQSRGVRQTTRVPLMQRCAFALLAMSATALAFSVSSARAQSPTQPKPGGTLVMILNPEPAIIASALNSSSPVYTVSPKIFEGLVTYDPQFKMLPQ